MIVDALLALDLLLTVLGLGSKPSGPAPLPTAEVTEVRCAYFDKEYETCERWEVIGQGYAPEGTPKKVERK